MTEDPVDRLGVMMVTMTRVREGIQQMVPDMAAVVRMAGMRVGTRLRRGAGSRSRRGRLVRPLAGRNMDRHGRQSAPLRAIAGTIKERVHPRISARWRVMERAIRNERHAAVQRLTEQASRNWPAL